MKESQVTFRSEEARTRDSPSTARVDFGVCSLVVTYHPNLEELREALTRAAQGSRYVVVIDNTTDERYRSRIKELVDEVSSLPHPSGAISFVLKASGRNLGLSKAYNIGAEEARRLGAKFLLLLDQDSLLSAGAISTLVEQWVELSKTFAVGSVSCKNIEEISVNVGLEPVANKMTRVLNERRHAKDSLARTGSAMEISTFTNSGTLISLERYEGMGPFNTALFLDAVDYDYSLRLRANGFKLFVVDRAELYHRQGSHYNREVLGISLELRTYSPTRSYWIVRDTMEFARLWFRRFPGGVLPILNRQVSGTLGAILLLGDRRERGRLVLQALSDFGHRVRRIPME